MPEFQLTVDHDAPDHDRAYCMTCDNRPAQVCEWFAKCDRPATHNEPHPILGAVPACDRCPKVGE